MRISMLLFGTRGDVQPYIALGMGLARAGHRVQIASHPNFESFVKSHGLDFLALGGDATQLIQDLMAAGQNPVKFAQAWLTFFEPMIHEAMEYFWDSTQDADVYIPNVFGVFSYHVAERRGVPYLRTALYPYERTRELTMFMLPPLPLGGLYNYMSFTGYEIVQQETFRRYFNTWRKAHGLPPNRPLSYPYRFLADKPVPSLFAYSEQLVPRPTDWAGHIHLTGFWFLDAQDHWQPPQALVDFLNADEPPVYIGFGSLSGNPNYARLINASVEALRKTKQRGILVTAWGSVEHLRLPDNVFQIDSVPHDWLFPRVKTVVHHGGAGTTSAGLRAGKPSIILPYFGDQPFWGQQVLRAGVGPQPIHQNRVTADNLAYALRVATTHAPMIQQAAALGEKLRAEDGVGNAVRLIERYTTSA